MSARVLAGSEASGRLAELGLTIELIERVVRRADAEASICTALDPPIMEGLTRWGRMNRFLREELIPAGGSTTRVTCRGPSIPAASSRSWRPRETS